MSSLPAATSIAGKALLVSGPDGSLAACIAEAARARGARVALALEGSLDSEAEADRLVEAAVARLSGLDALIAVVAAGPVDALHELAAEDWNGRVARPLRQAFLLAQRSVDEFLAGPRAGRLIFVAEPPARGTPSERNEIVEAGLFSLARSIAKEYGRRGLACNAVVCDGGTGQGASAEETLRRIVAAALFLASPDASFVNGETLVVRASADEADSRDGRRP